MADGHDHKAYAPKLIATSRITLSGDPVHILSIEALPRFNQTKVECVAYFADGSPEEQSDPAILIINDHGLFSNVKNSIVYFKVGHVFVITEAQHYNNTYIYTDTIRGKISISNSLFNSFLLA